MNNFTYYIVLLAPGQKTIVQGSVTAPTAAVAIAVIVAGYYSGDDEHKMKAIADVRVYKQVEILEESLGAF